MRIQNSCYRYSTSKYEPLLEIELLLVTQSTTLAAISRKNPFLPKKTDQQLLIVSYCYRMLLPVWQEEDTNEPGEKRRPTKHHHHPWLTTVIKKMWMRRARAGGEKRIVTTYNRVRADTARNRTPRLVSFDDFLAAERVAEGLTTEEKTFLPKKTNRILLQNLVLSVACCY
jgi:hypothetical protein